MILAIDPGTKCGWAVCEAGEIIVSGVWNLKPGRLDGGGMRFVHLERHLNYIGDAYTIRECYFEEVRRHLGTDASQVYGGIIAIIMAWCERREIPYQGIPVGTIKCAATGNDGPANRT